jgi:hypothetical protein
MGAIWRRLWRAIWNGLLIAAVAFFVYSLVDLFITRADLPRLQRGPHVWLYYWPTVFWSHGHYLKDKDEIATFLINILTYSAIVFFVAHLRRRSIADGTPDGIN